MVGFWKKKIVVRPIIDWTDQEIWEYIHKYNLPYCELYDKGFERIGCIGCPLNSKSQKKELDMYPKFKDLYIRAFDRMIEERHKKGKECSWSNGKEVYKWWIGEAIKQKEIEGQCSFFGDQFAIGRKYEFYGGLEMKKEEYFFEWKLDQKSLFYLSAIISGVAHGRKDVVELKKEAEDLLKDLYIQTHEDQVYNSKNARVLMLEKIYEKITGRCWHNYTYILGSWGFKKCLKCEKIKV